MFSNGAGDEDAGVVETTSTWLDAVMAAATMARTSALLNVGDNGEALRPNAAISRLVASSSSRWTAQVVDHDIEPVARQPEREALPMPRLAPVTRATRVWRRSLLFPPNHTGITRCSPNS